MNTPETINIEKYAEALNNLIGIDSVYMVGDKDVDAIVEVIVAAKKLESRVKELTEENKRLRNELDHTEKALIVLDKAHNALFTDTFRIEAEAKADTVRKMQEKISAKSEYGTINISPWQLDQIAKEMLEEKNDV